VSSLGRFLFRTPVSGELTLARAVKLGRSILGDLDGH